MLLIIIFVVFVVVIFIFIFIFIIIVIFTITIINIITNIGIFIIRGLLFKKFFEIVSVSNSLSFQKE